MTQRGWGEVREMSLSLVKEWALPEASEKEATTGIRMTNDGKRENMES